MHNDGGHDDNGGAGARPDAAAVPPTKALPPAQAPPAHAVPLTKTARRAPILPPAPILLAPILMLALALAPGAGLAARARAAGSLRVNDTGHLRLLKSYGSTLIEQGSVSGTLPGQCHVHMTVGSIVNATFSIATRYGTIYGSGRARLHSSGRYASFGGSLSVNYGTGRYARARGGGGLYGVIDRRTDALTVQTEGRLGY
jgi:hypothetical protein